MKHQDINRASGAGVGFVLALVIVVGLTAIVKFSNPAPAIDADRNAAIGKALAEIRKAENKALTTADWADDKRGIVRLPIETAMQITEREWQQDPAKARADLIARAEKAAAPAPTNAPAKPNKYE